MEIFKTVIEVVISITVAIMAVVLPVTIYNFKRENQIIKRKTKKGELIDLYGTFLIVPLFSLMIQIGIRGEVGIFKFISVFSSFFLPIEVIAILGYKAWKFCKQYQPSNNRIKKLEKIKHVAILLVNIATWIFYSLIMIYIVYFSHYGIIKDSQNLKEYFGPYIAMYLFLLTIYFIIGKLMIGTYKREYATKIKINYNYKGKDIEKEIKFNYFKVKTEYVSFYIENDNRRYIIPWDKVNDISVYYK